MFQRIKEYFAKLEEPTISDPVLGGLHDEGDFWWGHIHFPPTGTMIEVIIPNQGAEPQGRQRDYFLKIVEKYPSLEAEAMAAAARVVAAEMPRRIREAYQARPPSARTWEFELESITLPGVDDSEAAWGMTYFCRATGHDYTVHLKGWQVVRAENIGG